MKTEKKVIYTRMSSRLIKAPYKVMVLLLALIFSACTTAPPAPTQALSAAQSAIDTADQERVSDYALPELSQARDKLTAARTAVLNKDMLLARSLAEESRVSAELASARARKLKATRINEDMLESIETLKQEMQRNNGDML